MQRQVGLLSARLEVSSEVGRGSVFTLLLPTGTARHAAIQSEPEKTKTGSARTAKPHVLLVIAAVRERLGTDMLLSLLDALLAAD